MKTRKEIPVSVLTLYGEMVYELIPTTDEQFLQIDAYINAA